MSDALQLAFLALGRAEDPSCSFDLRRLEVSFAVAYALLALVEELRSFQVVGVGVEE